MGFKIIKHNMHWLNFSLVNYWALVGCRRYQESFRITQRVIIKRSWDTTCVKYPSNDQGQYNGGRKVVRSRSDIVSLELYCHDMAKNCTVPRWPTCQYHFQFDYGSSIFLIVTFRTGPRTGILSPRSYNCRSAGSSYPPVMLASW